MGSLISYIGDVQGSRLRELPLYSEIPLIDGLTFKDNGTGVHVRRGAGKGGESKCAGLSGIRIGRDIWLVQEKVRPGASGGGYKRRPIVEYRGGGDERHGGYRVVDRIAVGESVKDSEAAADHEISATRGPPG